MNLPTSKECEQIIKEFNVPENVILHSKLVQKLSIFISQKLIEKGIKLNIELISVAALLHDIDKIQTLQNGKHGDIAYDFLKDKYPEVAKVVYAHVKKRILKHPPITWEEKIVFYCDKITQSDKIVLFEDRIKNAHKDRIKDLKTTLPLVKQIEKEIFGQLDITPNDLKNLCSNEF